MFPIEAIYGLVAVFGVFLLLLFVRKSARKSIADSGKRPQLEDAEVAGAKDAKSAPSKKRKPTAKSDKPEKAKSTRPEQDAKGDDREADDVAERAALKAGLAKTRGGFVARLGKLFSKKKIDDDVLGELEEVLYTADIGPKTAERLFGVIKGALSRTELEDANHVWTRLRQETRSILDVNAEPLDFDSHRPFVLLTIGVNGVGKTTTIGKIAAKLTASGKKVILAAGDTFRAAAVEQLEIWGERAGCPVVKGKPNGDPSSVIFDAIQRAKDEQFDVVIADTAGRLHTKTDLMEELSKIGRVIDKAQPGAPHETILVLDSTTGQNAIQQAQLFNKAVDLTGIVLTKLDGTAKGGVILGISHELKLPVRFVGIGEGVEDLREFDADAFVDALYGSTEMDNVA